MHRISGEIDTSFDISSSSHSGCSRGLEQNKQSSFYETLSSQNNGIDNCNFVGDISRNFDGMHHCDIIPSSIANCRCPGIHTLDNNADTVRNDQQLRDIPQTHQDKINIDIKQEITKEIYKNVTRKSIHKLPKISPIQIKGKSKTEPTSPVSFEKPSIMSEENRRSSGTMSLSTGHLANMWHLKEKLGDGAFGSVWHAISRIDSQSYAIKMIPFYHKSESEESSEDCNNSVPISSAFDLYNQQSFREVRTMAKMQSHPSVVRYYTAWIEEMQPFIYEKIKDIDAMQSEPTDINYDDNDDNENYDHQMMIMPESLMMQDKDACNIDENECDIPRILDQSSKLRGITPLNESERISMDYDRDHCDYDYDEYDIKDESISFHPPSKSKKMPNRVLIIQMEMCDNGTLKDWLESRKEVDYIQSLQIFRQLVEALSHIHQNRTLHRDVKPGNAFLCKKGGIKLGDFGLSISPNDRMRRVVASINSKIFDEELTSGLGTPTYAAPEQLNHSHSHSHSNDDTQQQRDGLSRSLSHGMLNALTTPNTAYSKPADVYPLGLIAYELLNKWSTGMERVIAMNQLKRTFEISDTEFKERWPRMSYLIEAMVSLQPEERPTCEDILEVLDIEWTELQIECCGDAQSTCPQHSISMSRSISMSMSPRGIQSQSLNNNISSPIKEIRGSKFRRNSIHLLLSPTSDTSTTRTSFAAKSELCVDNDSNNTSPTKEEHDKTKLKKLEQELMTKDEEIEILKQRISKLETIINVQHEQNKKL